MADVKPLKLVDQGGGAGRLAEFQPDDTLPISLVAGLQAALDGKVDAAPGLGLSEESFTTAEKNKLAGVSAGATANATDAQLRDRATHTGTQAISTVAGLQSALDAIPKTVSAKLGVAATNSTLTPAVVLSVGIPAAGLYEIVASLRFRTAATTTGIALSLLAATGEINAMGRIAQAAAGTASFFEGPLTASAIELVSTAVLAANTDYPAMVTGYYLAVGPETLSLRFRSEVNASLVTVQPNSFLSAREVK